MTKEEGITEKSPARTFLRGQWLNLLMLNYEIDPQLLAHHIPAGTELDAWKGKTFVSMVGFLFRNTSVLGIPAFGYRNFEEVNLRFYVRRQVGSGLRRGVVFVREIVPKRLIAWMARAFYNEPYVALPMRHFLQMPGGNAQGHIGYKWLAGNVWNSLDVCFDGQPTLPPPDSEEAFITEHYWGYCRQRDGGTIEYQVEHPQWRVWRGQSANFHCDATRFYGPEFSAALGQDPSSAFVAEGSAVLVRRGQRLDP